MINDDKAWPIMHVIYIMAINEKKNQHYALRYSGYVVDTTLCPDFVSSMQILTHKVDSQN